MQMYRCVDGQICICVDVQMCRPVYLQMYRSLDVFIYRCIDQRLDRRNLFCVTESQLWKFSCGSSLMCCGFCGQCKCLYSQGRKSGRGQTDPIRLKHMHARARTHTHKHRSFPSECGTHLRKCCWQKLVFRLPAQFLTDSIKRNNMLKSLILMMNIYVVISIYNKWSNVSSNKAKHCLFL